MRKKLIFLDIDGTLTVPGAMEPAPAVRTALRSVRENGHRVFLCTGRCHGMCRSLLTPDFDGAVCSAGGYVLCGGQVIYSRPMADALRDRATEALTAAGFAWFIETAEAAFGSEQTLDLFAGAVADRPGDSEAARWQAVLRSGLGFRLLPEYRGEPVYKIVFVGEADANLQQAEQALGETFSFCTMAADFSRDGRIHGELMQQGADKGTGIQRICAYLHMPLEDTIGFGDSMNDLPMLETAGVSVCMENGEEELKRISDLVCPSVQENGLVTAFVWLGLISSEEAGTAAP